MQPIAGARISPAMKSSLFCLAAAVSLLPIAGCASLLGIKPVPTAAEWKAAPTTCFRSYATPASSPNPKATPAIRAWYQSLTPAIVNRLADGVSYTELGDRAIAHAVEAGVPESDFLEGESPDPERACGLSWSHEDIGNNRHANAASAAASVTRRAAFTACAAEFDALWPRLSTLAADAERSVRELPGADPDAAWALYHRLMTQQAQIIPVDGDGDVPVFAYTGAPYVVFTDLMTRFPGTAAWFLASHWLGGVSPLPDAAERAVRPLPPSAEAARFDYCAQVAERQGALASPLSPDDVEQLSPTFDGAAWLEALPTPATVDVHLGADDFRGGRVIDRASGRSKTDEETFRLYRRPITALRLDRGAGTIELTTVDEVRQAYDCKRVVKVKQESSDTASISHEEKCKTNVATTTDRLTLAVTALPAGVTLAVGDQLVFYANRTATSSEQSKRDTRTGTASTRTITSAAELVFLAQVQRDAAVIYPAR